MTRETKIGLLVGLAFIIVIGILLSDHLSTTNQPAPAPMNGAGRTVANSLGDDSVNDVNPVVRAPAPTLVMVPSNVTPTQPVMTTDELAGRRVATAKPTTPSVPAQLARLAHDAGEDVVAMGTGPAVPMVPTPPEVLPAAPIVATCRAEDGDSLGDLAMKAYGTSNRAAREAIVAANPSLQTNRNLIVAGRSYNAPALANAHAAAAPVPAATVALARPARTAEVHYTVQAGDTLWSIASAEVGTPDAVAAIKDLNRDVLKGTDRVRPHMKLRLPKKADAQS